MMAWPRIFLPICLWFLRFAPGGPAALRRWGGPRAAGGAEASRHRRQRPTPAGRKASIVRVEHTLGLGPNSRRP
ncbi:hypothetical protein B0T24DRAFT_638561 [Lasiosphaeria ovina]|uniref:Secreted protein n=1 Tax=Lasiosphaeria ovina TaxID=92902 RepID=A0AAE0JVC8_9PEZI|nr:hypothetical protein B0T24DRAFT_638561 [Lasiosphaeria ovina]